MRTITARERLCIASNIYHSIDVCKDVWLRKSVGCSLLWKNFCLWFKKGQRQTEVLNEMINVTQMLPVSSLCCFLSMSPLSTVCVSGLKEEGLTASWPEKKVQMTYLICGIFERKLLSNVAKSCWRAESASQSDFPQCEKQDRHKYILFSPPHFPFFLCVGEKHLKCGVTGYCAARHLFTLSPSFSASQCILL